jgi:hypothetical protein
VRLAGRRDLIADGPVGGEIVLPAEQVVIHPGDVRHRRVEPGGIGEGPATS